MCGIVGFIGSDINHQVKRAFKDLLVIDTIRGGDSTGFLGVEGSDVVTVKKATDGYAFTSMTMFTKQLGSLLNPTVLLGHNRWATKGRVTDGNAHPFKCGTTHLVHNGSLEGSSWMHGDTKLHNSIDTDVDSEAICFNIEHEGLKNTVEKLDGAFVLVTYDEITQCVAFTRNKERTLYFATVKDKDLLIFASEAGMISLVCDKYGIPLQEEPWLLKPDMLMTFDVGVSKDVLETRELDEAVVPYVKPAPARRVPYWEKYPYYQKQGGVQVTTPTKKPEPNNVIALPSPNKKSLSDFSVSKDEQLMYVAFKFTPFTSGKGMITGHIYGDIGLPEELGEAVMYQRTELEYKAMRGRLVKVQAESVSQQLPCVRFIHSLSKLEQESYWEAHYTLLDQLAIYNGYVEEEELDYVGTEGESITASEFAKLVILGCCMCGDDIIVDECVSRRVGWVLDDSPLCPHCHSLHSAIAEREGWSLDEQVTGGVM